MEEVNECHRYLKKIKFAEKLLDHNSPLRNDNITHLDDYKKLDTLYILSHNFCSKAPMWVGFNALHVKDDSKMQKIYYLPPINESPTEKSVVFETMQRAQAVASECNVDDAEV